MSALDVPPPVLYNAWKHHLLAIRATLPALAALSPEEAGARLVVLGGGLMDMYTGPRTAADVAAWVLDELRRDGRLDPEPFRAWLAGQGDYATLTDADGTAWVLRASDVEGRHVHLHPGRHSPNTVRARANVVKTAIAVALLGGEPTRRRVNDARQRYLGLPPVGRAPDDEAGLGAFLTLLRG